MVDEDKSRAHKPVWFLSVPWQMTAMSENC